MQFPDSATRVAKALVDAGGRAMFVGGCVRDRLMGLESKDIDLEAYGLHASTIEHVLRQFGEVREVGVHFGVFKLKLEDGTDIDISLPRRERKIAPGHTGFAVDYHAGVEPYEAASRRDFTINAMAVDSATGELLDFFGGVHDLHRRILRHTSTAFAEDPLRVLRAMQFAGRFNMGIADDTAKMCRALRSEYEFISNERVWCEWEKLATRSKYPSRGIAILIRTGWHELYPEISGMMTCPQDLDWHPEGPVIIHAQFTADAAVAIADRDELAGDDRLVLFFAALCHDMGKVSTTSKNAAGRWISPGHAEAGVGLTESFLLRIGFPGRLIARVSNLVAEHMAHISFGAEPKVTGYDIVGDDGTKLDATVDEIAGDETLVRRRGQRQGSKRAVRRLAMRLASAGNTVTDLARLVEADHSGRPPLPGGVPSGMARIVAMAADLNLQAAGPTPILMGRHLVEMGMQPSPAFGTFLAAAMEAQLDGEFEDLEGAIAWATSRG